MQVNLTIPLEVEVHSYDPGTPGCTSGPPDAWYPPESPDIEFEVFTLTGSPLDESDFRPAEWRALYFTVLAAHEAELRKEHDEATVSLWEDAKYWAEN